MPEQQEISAADVAAMAEMLDPAANVALNVKAEEQTIYRTSDGSEFLIEADAQRYEANHELAKMVNGYNGIAGIPMTDAMKAMLIDAIKRIGPQIAPGMWELLKYV